jgi:hypothetical protein
MKIFETGIFVNEALEVQKYADSITFNTPENHVPLHNDLFEKYGAKFDIHTRGEMPDNILQIFSKIGKYVYDHVVSIEQTAYHPPMFSKNYIARYRNGLDQPPYYDPTRPENTYRAYMFWNDVPPGAELVFPNIDYRISPKAGTLFIFKETVENLAGFTSDRNGQILISEFWMSPVGSAPFKNVVYDNVQWDSWEIKGF